MAIEGIVGLPGSGKTLLGCKKLIEAHNAGMKVFANFTSRYEIWERVIWSDVVRMSNALVVLDEAHMWFPAREWKAQTQQTLAVFQQHRKEGLDLVWIAQHESRIDVALRELTSFLYYVKRVGPICLVMKVEGVKGGVVGRSFFWAKDFFDAYFTEERVLGRDERCGDPVVGITPNFARYEDEFGHVRIRRRVRDWSHLDCVGDLPTHQYYSSPWSGGCVEWPVDSGASATEATAASGNGSAPHALLGGRKS